MRSPYLPEASAVAAAVQFPALTVQLSVPVPEAALRTSKRGGGRETKGAERVLIQAAGRKGGAEAHIAPDGHRRAYASLCARGV
jgi:hypothetical protein